MGGDGRGRGIGLPTANLEIPADTALPSRGVYAARAVLASGRSAAAVNIGVAPDLRERSIRVRCASRRSCSTTTAATSTARRCASTSSSACATSALRDDRRADGAGDRRHRAHPRAGGAPPPQRTRWSRRASRAPGAEGGLLSSRRRGACRRCDPPHDMRRPGAASAAPWLSQEKHDADQGRQVGGHRYPPPPRDRHGLAAGAGGHPHREDQRPHRAPEGPQEGPPLAARSSPDGGAPSATARTTCSAPIWTATASSPKTLGLRR